ncbi:lasso peptide biosynthesis B2 protein [Ectopseudomonas mendocina]|uniref:lasso peptide biosynthesis B2 protein n=1 Tax=Ectopseudomonas mendocina TaxID=300 RepID=UPI003EFCFE70
MYAQLRCRLHNFLRKPRAQRYALPIVWPLLGLSRALVLLLPFRLLHKLLGAEHGPYPLSCLATPQQTRRALDIGRTVRWAACHTPWHSNCFAQALTARMLLGAAGIPCVTCFGLSRDEHKALIAHAWVSVGPIRVCGGDGFARYTVVGCFVTCGRKTQ